MIKKYLLEPQLEYLSASLLQQQANMQSTLPQWLGGICLVLRESQIQPRRQ